MGGAGAGNVHHAGATDMQIAHEEAPQGIAAAELGADLLDEADHAGEGVVGEAMEVSEGGDVGGRRGGVDEGEGVVEDVGEGVHGAVAVTVGENGAEGERLVVAEGEETGDRFLVDDVEVLQEDLL